MEEIRETRTWREELASLVEDPGIRYAGEPIEISTPSSDAEKPKFVIPGEPESEPENLKDQITGFMKAWGEMLMELGRGCRDIVQQNIITEDSFIVKKFSGPAARVSGRLRFLNDQFLPEDRDPVHAWPVIIFVFILALTALDVNSKHDSSLPSIKEVRAHPPSASCVLLPDGRKMAYHEQGVEAKRARFSLIAPHPFLSSRLAGMPGVKASVLEEYGIRLITYDLPGFGESDPHHNRDLNSSAFDIIYLADSIGVNDKFWVLGYSSGSMHGWAALRYISSKIAGAAFVAPMINPYEPSMTKEEVKRTWGTWLTRRKLMYLFARRFPKFLSFFYRRSFLSGKHGRIDKWMSLSLGRKDVILIEEPMFEEFWHRDVEESVRQGNVKPFVEETRLLVSNWGFSLSDLQVQTKCQKKGILPWLRSMYSQAECELTGFLGPIHIWQGMDDQVVPPSMIDYILRVLPYAKIHKLPTEGHFSYFYFCDECHRQIFSTLFGSPLGPLDLADKTQMEGTPVEKDNEFIVSGMSNA